MLAYMSAITRVAVSLLGLRGWDDMVKVGWILEALDLMGCTEVGLADKYCHHPYSTSNQYLGLDFGLDIAGDD